MNPFRVLQVVCSISALTLGAACGGADDRQSEAQGAPGSAAVTIADFMFDQAAVTVGVGESVTWTNSDDQPHTATGVGVFDTGAIAPTQSVTVAFPTAGTFAYVCSFHPFMTGSVVVE